MCNFRLLLETVQDRKNIKNNTMKSIYIFLLTLPCLFISLNINAQIVYHDIQDTSINLPIIEYLGDETIIYNLDINMDSTFDFYFYLSKWQVPVSPDYYPIYHVSEIYGYQENKTCIVESSIAPCTFVFNESDTIDMNCSWNDGQFSAISISVEGFGASCDIPFQDKYYGLWFNIGGNNHFGWIHMDINSYGEIFLKGYAYNTIPDQLIRAGQMESNSINDDLSENQIIISCTKYSLLIKQTNNKELVEKVSIYNLSGVIVLEQEIDDYQAKVNLFYGKSGIYIVRVLTGNYVYSKLIYVN